VIAIDTNLLVYAHRRDSEWHEAAAALVRTCAERREAWAIPWPCLHEFLAIVTHPRIFAPPTTLAQALDQLDAWMESPSLVLLAEAPTHWTTLRSQLEAGRITGPRVHDARVAALCLSHGVSELWTADRDFSRFADLAVRNPLLDRA
jgi:toxin-antitoxin system PIN domain toxin